MNQRWLQGFWASTLLIGLPLLLLYLSQLWQIDRYQYFPVLLFAFGALLFSRWDGVWHAPNTVGVGMLVVGTLLIGAGVAFWSPWLGCVGSVMNAGAFLASHKQEKDLPGALISLWVPLLLLIRLPLNKDYELTLWLQGVTSDVASYLLDRVGITHRLTGNVFHLPNGELFVEAACSGVQSVFALFFCAIMLVVWQFRPLILLPLYLLFAVCWAALMNVMRVFAIAYTQEVYGWDLSHGWKHEVLGYLTLAIAIGLLASTDRLLRVLFFPVPEGSGAGKYNPCELGWNQVFGREYVAVPDSKSWKVLQEWSLIQRRPQGWAVAAAVLCLVALVPQFSMAISVTSSEKPVDLISWSPNEEFLTDALGTGIRVLEYKTTTEKTDPSLGRQAHVWTCVLAGLPARIVVSQHDEFHDLCSCYEGNGWRELSREVMPDTGQTDWDTVQAAFVDSERNSGYLVYATLDSLGNPVEARRVELGSLFLGRVGDREGPGQSFDDQSINIQIWVQSLIPIKEEQLDVIRSAHEKVKTQVRTQFSGLVGAKE